ncbi:hypothetical protein ILUMI_18495, partial [Ignelater luminosus]
HNKLRLYKIFASVIGVIDYTHIAIVAPPAENEEFPGRLFINRKVYHSINCQIICEADLKILAVNERYPGSVHDAAIWSTSAIYQHGERSSRLLGDSGYPLQPWLFTQIIRAAANTLQGNYNRRLASARNTIEICIGIWKMKFRCLLHHWTLHYDHVRAGKIIYACSVLHNMCNQHNLPKVEEEPLEENEETLVNIPVHDLVTYTRYVETGDVKIKKKTERPGTVRTPRLIKKVRESL